MGKGKRDIWRWKVNLIPTEKQDNRGLKELALVELTSASSRQAGHMTDPSTLPSELVKTGT